MVFQKGRKKSGGRKKGTSNKVTESIKSALNALLPEDELAGLWQGYLYHDDPHIAFEAFKLANHYMFGKPVQAVVGDEDLPPVTINVFRDPEKARACMNDLGDVWLGDFYTPQPVQVRFHESEAVYPLMEGGRGGGKSTALLWEGISECVMVPGANALILRRTLTAMEKGGAARRLRSSLIGKLGTTLEIHLRGLAREPCGCPETTVFRRSRSSIGFLDKSIS